MSLTIRPAGPADRADWDAFVAARPEGDILQAWAWGDVMRSVGEPPERLLATDEQGRVRGVAQALVRRTTAGRSVVYVPHGPLWEREAEDAGALLPALIDALARNARRTGGIVVKVDPRARADGAGGDAAAVGDALRAVGLRPARHDLQARLTRLLDVAPDEEARIGAWSAGTRNLWRRALREGTIVDLHRDADPAAMAAFAALQAGAAARGGFRTHGPSFHLALATALAPAGGWYLALARHEAQPIAAMAVARTGDRAFYLYGAADRAAPPHAYGSYAAMGTMLGALAEDGVRTLDLWGVADPDDPDADPTWRGFSAFKRRFGGRELRHPGTFDLVVSGAWYALRDLRERLAAPR